jgi:hypothetical protein
MMEQRIKTLDDHIRAWAAQRVRVHESSAIRTSDLFRAFQQDSELPAWGSRSDGYSVSPRRFSLVMRKLYPSARRYRSNGTYLAGVQLIDRIGINSACI